jgi:hypothetical protein
MEGCTCDHPSQQSKTDGNLARTLYGIYGVRTVVRSSNVWPYHGIYECRVGRNRTYTEHPRYVWQKNYQIYGHIRWWMCTVLANPTNIRVA